MTALADCRLETSKVDHGPGLDPDTTKFSFTLIGPEGGVEVDLVRAPPGSGIHAIAEQFRDAHAWDEQGGAWTGHGVVVHSKTPIYPDQGAPHESDCEVTGGECWFDVGYLMSDLIMKGWMKKGADNETMAVLLFEVYKEFLL